MLPPHTPPPPDDADSPPVAPPTASSGLDSWWAQLDRRTGLRSIAINGLFVMALFVVLRVGRQLFIPLGFALLLWFVLRPAVRAMGRLRLPRAVSSALLLATLLAGCGLAVNRLVDPAVAWFDRLPVAMRVLEHRLRPLRKSAEGVSDLAERVTRMAQLKDGPVRKVEVDEPSLLDRFVDLVIELAAGTVIVLFATFFMLTAGDRMMQRLLGRGPIDPAGAAGASMNHLERGMSHYLRTISLINTGLGLAVGTTMFALGMPNPVLWGVLAGVVNFVPYLGAMVGIGCVGLAALTTFNEPAQALLPPLAYLLVTALEGNLITPLIIGNTFRINALAVFVWVLFWAWMWGAAGAILAAPLLMLLVLTSEKSPTLKPIADLLKA